MLSIRKATINDLEAITAIYNEAVRNTTATFDTVEKTVEDRKDWFLNRDENFPVIVAEKNGAIVGYASLSKWSERKAYDITAEISLYIYSDYRGQGIGKRILDMIVKMSAETNLHSIIARISEGNEQSIYLHKSQGFETIGVMKKAGRKFDKILDVTFMQKMLK